LLISNDTGIRNMAIAVNTPTVGIFLVIQPFKYWPREGGHDCIFNLESQPSVEDVYKSAISMI
jgi:ADP-heptose:LPS heptosyltransferase